MRHLSPNQVGVLSLFFDEQMQPEVGRYIGWNELEAAEKSNLISKSARFSPTFLDAVLETLVRDQFLLSSGDSYALSRLLPF